MGTCDKCKHCDMRKSTEELISFHCAKKDVLIEVAKKSGEGLVLMKCFESKGVPRFLGLPPR